jgi:hypothetical protein
VLMSTPMRDQSAGRGMERTDQYQTPLPPEHCPIFAQESFP